MFEEVNVVTIYKYTAGSPAMILRIKKGDKSDGRGISNLKL
jgi:hypothetical protein